MSNEERNKDYVWVIVETVGEEDNFVGLNDSQSGETFIPVTSDRDHGLMLVARLPNAPQGATRQVEAIHKKRLMDIAGAEGFAVYLVDQEGRLLERLDPVMAN